MQVETSIATCHQSFATQYQISIENLRFQELTFHISLCVLSNGQVEWDVLQVSFHL
jgi:hypothetical protein